MSSSTELWFCTTETDHNLWGRIQLNIIKLIKKKSAKLAPPGCP